ncbi:CHAT domain-containing protein [Bizionia argentinensis JUB59]|uniref:CHAT domain-containing protein n=1 Tax=Bizionia argentinensis JUB59 TaxID=1046627 RepID=G2ED16_9FLAO|nr:CHAT domain-containing protein [Bizionia argentinensis]EGV43639.1 CHAT domain-containing protein [Bizionia argentinensis JUB59]
MKVRHYLFILLLTHCSISFGQDWVKYSDSIIWNITNSNYSKAKDFLSLAEKDLAQSNFKKDTVYADFLYRKGLLSYFQDENPEMEFNESIAIWTSSDKINLKKLMRLYYFFGNYFFDVKNYDKAYQLYLLCYETGQQINFDSISDFKEVTYHLYLIERWENSNNSEAVKWSKVYIDFNKNQAVKEFNFRFVQAYGFVHGEVKIIELLEKYLKSYYDREIENELLIQKINFELMNSHYFLDNYTETINYGEESLNIIERNGLSPNSDKELIYSLLIIAYQQIGDNINQEKYEQLKRQYFPNVNEIDYYDELDRLIKTYDYSAFESQFKIYEEELKKEKNYDELVSIYMLSLTLFERSILYDKVTIENQISFLELHRNKLSAESNVIFDLLIAEYSFFTQDFLTTLKLCNRNLEKAGDDFKLIFLKFKAIAERMLGLPNANETAYKTIAFSRELFGSNNPQILPYLILPLSINNYGTDNRSTAIATEALQLIYAHNLEQTDIAAQIWYLLGNEAILKNNFKDAERYFKKALTIYSNQEQVTNPSLYYSCLLGLANTSLLQAEYVICWSYLEKARDFIASQNNLMTIAYGDYYDALGHYYFYQDDFFNAKIAYENSFSFYGEELSKGRKMNLILCNYFIEMNVEKTIEQLEGFYQVNGDVSKVLKIIYILKFNTGQDAEARKLLLDGIHQVISNNDSYFHLLSDAERETLYVDFTDEFEFLNTHLLLTNNQEFLEEYLNLRFYFKSLLLYNTKQSNTKNHLKIANYKQLKENTILLNTYFEQSSDFSNEIEELQHKNRELEKSLSNGKSQLESPTLKSVKNQLMDKEAYVEIIRINKQSRSATKDKLNILNKFTDSISYGAFIVKKHGPPKFILIDSTSALENEFLKTYQNYSKGTQKFKTDTSSYNVFFKPVENALKGIETVFLVTDGVYNAMNTESLYNTEKNQYVIEYLNIKPILSARSLTKEKELDASVESGKAILIGNPDYELVDFSTPNPEEMVLDPSISMVLRSNDFSRTISYLPGTEREIQTIFTILEADNWDTELYRLDTATEDNLKKVASPKVLHIATHGYFIGDESLTSSDDKLFGISSNYVQDNSLLKSGLLLAGAQNTIDGHTIPLVNNGILTAQEAKGLDLKGTELVVLSACETGEGDRLIGEGVYGLQRAFMLAGAKSVIMSFWNVNDDTTQRLMTYFYTNWIEKGIPKYDAFRLAKLKLKDEFPEPFYWAPFILIE